MLKRATCLSCDAELPLAPARFTISLGPAKISCGGCGETIDTTFAYRVRFSESALHRLFMLLSLPLSLYLAITQTQYSDTIRIALALAGPIAFGFGLGFVLSRIVALPLQIAVDKIRS